MRCYLVCLVYLVYLRLILRGVGLRSGLQNDLSVSVTNNYASMTHGKKTRIVGEKLGKGNVTRNASGVNPFPPRIQPLRT